MATMNWGELKKYLEDRGVKDDMVIWYFDFTYPERVEDKYGSLTVGLPDKRDGLAVHN